MAGVDQWENLSGTKDKVKMPPLCDVNSLMKYFQRVYMGRGGLCVYGGQRSTWNDS